MSRTVVCYLERMAGGNLIRRVRLVGDGGPAPIDRSWAAPPMTVGAGGSGAGGETSPEAAGPSTEAVNHTRAAARWVADSLETLGSRRLAMVCVDPDGSVCTWLSAPSADASMIQATLAQPDADDSGAGGGAARLLALGGGPSSSGFSAAETSVQALATLERSGGGRGKAAISGRRERFAVLAVPDAPVRVFLDELDSRGVEVDQVVSLWHALAMAWDPGRQDVSDGGAGGAASERVVASQSPSAAIVAVDPLGRLVWAWSQSGQLVAGGTMRLKTVAPPAPPSPATAAVESDETGTARRLPGAAAAEEAAVIEFTGADTGRLVLDWLSWSAQLGHCPQRVACIGPAAASSVGGGAGEAWPDPGLIGRSLGEAWPGASVGVAVHNDPIGATMQRLLTHDIAQTHRRAAELSVAGGSDDPRGALVGLSSRPGRLDRRMHAWIALGVAAIAVVVGAVGWQLHRAAVGAEADIEAANNDRKEAIASVKDVVAGIDASTNPRQDLEAEIERLTKQNNSIKAPRPLLREMSNLLDSIAGSEDVKIDRFDLNPVTGVVNLRVPDAATGPAILEKIQKLSMFMKWTGSTPGGPAVDGTRRYNLTGLAGADTRPGGGGN